ncbi:Putative ribonuclease H protein At1g65750 [Linum perenne]
MTNEERHRRHLTNQVSCTRCSLASEFIEHVIRACPFAVQVWNAVLPLAISQLDGRLPFAEWWRKNLENKKCNTPFGITTWMLWKNRNLLIFENKRQPASFVAEQCRFWSDLILTSWKTNQLGREAPSLARQTQLVAWRPGDRSTTAISGLIRDARGSFIQAYIANIGDCSITRAEIRAIVEGTKLAWSLGIRKLNIQSDSSTAISLLSTDEDVNHNHASLVFEFKELRSRQWDITFTHVFREANYAADYLANLGHSLSFGIHVFSVADATLCYWLKYDLIGVAMPRLTLINT